VSRDQIEDLLKRVALAKPASGSRDRVLSGAKERATERARARYNATLKAASLALVVVVVAGIVLDRAASRRLERLIYRPVAQRDVETSTEELARELADELDGDDQAQIEKYFARLLSRSDVRFSYAGGGRREVWQEGDVWMKYLMEGEGKWKNQPG